jgi:hypothetical protein
MKYSVVIGVAFVFLALPSSAQTTTDKTDEAKKVSAAFVKALLVDRDIDASIKLAGVPFAHGWDRPAPKVSDTVEDLKERLGQRLAHKMKYTGNMKIRKIQSYEEYRVGFDDPLSPQPKMKEVYDKLMKKSDLVIQGSLESDDGFTANCHLMVAWPKGQSKVVSFEANHVAPIWTIQQSWQGGSDQKKDNDAWKQVPPGGVIAGRQGWERLWKAWQFAKELPTVDFTNNLILVAACPGPNAIRINDRWDAVLRIKGDLKFQHSFTEKGGDGFRYLIMRVGRDGVKTVNGKEIPKD